MRSRRRSRRRARPGRSCSRRSAGAPRANHVATLRDIRRRIRSVRSTAQITKTMEMVSAAKLRRAQTAVESARPYATDLRAVLGNLAQASGDAFHPAFAKREVRSRGIILVTSDRGLCGAFNTNL